MMPALIIISFIIGSIPTGLLIAKSKGIDLRKVGSGNIGATNVLRAVGKEAALFTLLGDIAKGAVPVAIAKTLALDTLDAGIVGLSAILGHNFSLFLKFKGGKGVSASIGVLLAFSPYVAIFTIVLWLLTAKWTRYSSLSALVSFGLLPLSIYMIDYSKEKMIIAAAITVLIYIRHAANIKRLIQGTESKIGQKV
ncbi:MAG: glycerol-3-phosphate 1-O-acyltransferase PlsY [Nitrospirae bacterium]|nr:glycerol-3-phosphate 1-O-acyltransferase PlsY [Nitrospirota bacterium]MCL5062425.1 glycerol-3-phosphate 1-O-acyltransferase PlsY [Nitrospirota bacterium]